MTLMGDANRIHPKEEKAIGLSIGSRPKNDNGQIVTYGHRRSHPNAPPPHPDPSPNNLQAQVYAPNTADWNRNSDLNYENDQMIVGDEDHEEGWRQWTDEEDLFICSHLYGTGGPFSSSSSTLSLPRQEGSASTPSLPSSSHSVSGRVEPEVPLPFSWDAIAKALNRSPTAVLERWVAVLSPPSPKEGLRSLADKHNGKGGDYDEKGGAMQIEMSHSTGHGDHHGRLAARSSGSPQRMIGNGDHGVDPEHERQHKRRRAGEKRQRGGDQEEEGGRSGSLHGADSDETKDGIGQYGAGGTIGVDGMGSDDSSGSKCLEQSTLDEELASFLQAMVIDRDCFHSVEKLWDMYEQACDKQRHQQPTSTTDAAANTTGEASGTLGKTRYYCLGCMSRLRTRKRTTRRIGTTIQHANRHRHGSQSRTTGSGSGDVGMMMSTSYHEGQEEKTKTSTDDNLPKSLSESGGSVATRSPFLPVQCPPLPSLLHCPRCHQAHPRPALILNMCEYASREAFESLLGRDDDEDEDRDHNYDHNENAAISSSLPSSSSSSSSSSQGRSLFRELSKLDKMMNHPFKTPIREQDYMLTELKVRKGKEDQPEDNDGLGDDEKRGDHVQWDLDSLKVDLRMMRGVMSLLSTAEQIRMLHKEHGFDYEEFETGHYHHQKHQHQPQRQGRGASLVGPLGSQSSLSSSKRTASCSHLAKDMALELLNEDSSETEAIKLLPSESSQWSLPRWWWSSFPASSSLSSAQSSSRKTTSSHPSMATSSSNPKSKPLDPSPPGAEAARASSATLSSSSSSSPVLSSTTPLRDFSLVVLVGESQKDLDAHMAIFRDMLKKPPAHHHPAATSPSDPAASSSLSLPFVGVPDARPLPVFVCVNINKGKNEKKKENSDQERDGLSSSKSSYHHRRRRHDHRDHNGNKKKITENGMEGNGNHHSNGGGDGRHSKELSVVSQNHHQQQHQEEQEKEKQKRHEFALFEPLSSSQLMVFSSLEEAFHTPVLQAESILRTTRRRRPRKRPSKGASTSQKKRTEEERNGKRIRTNQEQAERQENDIDNKQPPTVADSTPAAAATSLLFQCHKVAASASTQPSPASSTLSSSSSQSRWSNTIMKLLQAVLLGIESIIDHDHHLVTSSRWTQEIMRKENNETQEREEEEKEQERRHHELLLHHHNQHQHQQNQPSGMLRPSSSSSLDVWRYDVQNAKNLHGVLCLGLELLQQLNPWWTKAANEANQATDGDGRNQQNSSESATVQESASTGIEDALKTGLDVIDSAPLDADTASSSSRLDSVVPQMVYRLLQIDERLRRDARSGSYTGNAARAGGAVSAGTTASTDAQEQKTGDENGTTTTSIITHNTSKNMVKRRRIDGSLGDEDYPHHKNLSHRRASDDLGRQHHARDHYEPLKQQQHQQQHEKKDDGLDDKVIAMQEEEIEDATGFHGKQERGVASTPTPSGAKDIQLRSSAGYPPSSVASRGDLPSNGRGYAHGERERGGRADRSNRGFMLREGDLVRDRFFGRIGVIERMKKNGSEISVYFSTGRRRLARGYAGMALDKWLSTGDEWIGRSIDYPIQGKVARWLPSGTGSSSASAVDPPLSSPRSSQSEAKPLASGASSSSSSTAVPANGTHNKSLEPQAAAAPVSAAATVAASGGGGHVGGGMPSSSRKYLAVNHHQWVELDAHEMVQMLSDHHDQPSSRSSSSAARADAGVRVGFDQRRIKQWRFFFPTSSFESSGASPSSPTQQDPFSSLPVSPPRMSPFSRRMEQLVLEYPAEAVREVSASAALAASEPTMPTSGASSPVYHHHHDPLPIQSAAIEGTRVGVDSSSSFATAAPRYSFLPNTNAISEAMDIHEGDTGTEQPPPTPAVAPGAAANAAQRRVYSAYSNSNSRNSIKNYGSSGTYDQKEQGEKCTICLEPLDYSEATGAIVPCSHEFHMSCLERLVKASDDDLFFCPLCRIQFTSIKSLSVSSNVGLRSSSRNRRILAANLRHRGIPKK